MSDPLPGRPTIGPIRPRGAVYVLAILCYAYSAYLLGRSSYFAFLLLLFLLCAAADLFTGGMSGVVHGMFMCPAEPSGWLSDVIVFGSAACFLLLCIFLYPLGPMILLLICWSFFFACFLFVLTKSSSVLAN